MIRQIVLRAMLVMLGLATFLAMYSIFDGSDTSWRLVGTALIVAIQIGLATQFLPSEASARTDLLQRTLIGHIALGGSLIIASLWLRQTIVRDVLMMWIFAGNASLIVAQFALRHRRTAERALARAEGVAIIGAFGSFGLGVVTALLPAPFNIESALSLSFTLLAGTIMLAMCAFGLRTPSTDRLSPLPTRTWIDTTVATVGSAAAVGWITLGLLGIAEILWVGFGVPAAPQRALSGFWTFAYACTSVSVPCGVACVLGTSRVTGPLAWIGRVAIACTAALGALNAYIAIDSFRSTGDWGAIFTGRVNGALAVSSMAAVIASLIVMRFHRGRSIEDGPIEHFDWCCPRCAVKSQIEPGNHTCATCGLFVSIALRDDRCPKCGYDLHAHALDARNCPECGRARQVTPFTSA